MKARKGLHTLTSRRIGEDDYACKGWLSSIQVFIGA